MRGSRPRRPRAALPAGQAAGSGVYCGGQDDSCVTSFEGWRGAPVGAVGTFLPRGTWDDIEIPGWWLDIWRDSPYRDRLVVTIGMLPDNGEWGGLDEGADGDFDEHFRVAAERLVASGLASAWIRPGHELNGGWYRWSARADPEAYAEYYRRIVTAMRSVPGADFRFDWNVAVGGDQHMDAREAYPGDEYVDAVGVDVYDSAWNMPGLTPDQRWDYLVEPDPGQGLQFWADFAAQQGKPLAFAEWGLVGEGSAMAGEGGAGGDNPEYIEHMHEWFAGHPLAYELYFDRDAPDGTHVISSSTTLFPQAAAALPRALRLTQAGVTSMRITQWFLPLGRSNVNPAFSNCVRVPL